MKLENFVKMSDLDYVIISHYDDDHLNGIMGAIHVFNCGTVLAPDYIADIDIYNSYTSAVQENRATVVHPRKGDEYARRYRPFFL